MNLVINEKEEIMTWFVNQQLTNVIVGNNTWIVDFYNKTKYDQHLEIRDFILSKRIQAETDKSLAEVNNNTPETIRLTSFITLLNSIIDKINVEL